MKKILLAEDDLFLQRIYASELRKAGYDVACASDGERTIQLMKTVKLDFIILDIIMPMRNGFEVLEEKRKSKTLAKIPVMVISSLGQQSDIDKAKYLGAIDYFVKTTVASSHGDELRLDVEGLITMVRKYLPAE